MQALETSIATDGWIGAITVAADGETFDGSARVEKTAENGMLDGAIVVDSDGTRPIVVRRTDIPTATDERAVRLGIAANRVAELNLEWEPDVLAGIADAGVDLGSLFTDQEWAEVSMPSLPDPGNGGDDFDATPDEGPTRTALGELWAIGPHRLLVGDCTDAANVARLMGGEWARLSPTDPPYNVDVEYSEEVDDSKTAEEYEQFSRAWFGVCQSVSSHQIVTPGGVNHISWARWFDSKHVGVWVKTNAPTFGRVSNSWCWEPVFFFGDKWPRRRANDVFDYPIGNQSGVGDHPCPKPLSMWIDILENYTDRGDLIYEPFSGSGTSHVAAHRTGRRCYGMEISPRYADVILRRAEAEGLECTRLD